MRVARPKSALVRNAWKVRHVCRCELLEQPEIRGLGGQDVVEHHNVHLRIVLLGLESGQRLGGEADHVLDPHVPVLLEGVDEIRAKVALPRAAERGDDEARGLRVDGGAGCADGEDEDRGEAQHPADGRHDVTSVRSSGGQCGVRAAFRRAGAGCRAGQRAPGTTEVTHGPRFRR
jgi:hypothetical protein